MKPLFIFASVAFLSAPAFPQGDTCANPIPFTMEGLYSFDTTNNTTSGFVGPGSCGTTLYNDVFYAFTATETLMFAGHTFDVCFNGQNLGIRIFSGTDCAAACAIDATNSFPCSNPNASQYVFVDCVEVGDTYLIQIGGLTPADAGPGAFSYGISQPALLSICTPNTNSTGLAAIMLPDPCVENVFAHIDVSFGPPNNFGYLVIYDAFEEPGLQLGDGRFCISSAPGTQFGRYNLQGTPMDSIGIFNSAGVFEALTNPSVAGTGFDVPNTLPIPGNPVLTAGDMWYMQLWYRDNGSSNFSNGLPLFGN